MIKSLITIFLSAVLFTGLGCKTFSLDPNASDADFATAVKIDSVKVKQLSYTATGIYLLNVSDLQKRERIAKSVGDVAVKTKEHVATLDIIDMADMRVLVLTLINQTSLSFDEKQIVTLLLDSISIVVDDQITINVPTNLSNDRRLLAVKSFVLGSCDGVIQATQIYGKTS